MDVETVVKSFVAKGYKRAAVELAINQVSIPGKASLVDAMLRYDDEESVFKKDYKQVQSFDSKLPFACALGMTGAWYEVDPYGRESGPYNGTSTALVESRNAGYIQLDNEHWLCVG